VLHYTRGKLEIIVNNSPYLAKLPDGEVVAGFSISDKALHSGGAAVIIRR
jgi:hypothetical protein